MKIVNVTNFIPKRNPEDYCLFIQEPTIEDIKMARDENKTIFSNNPSQFFIDKCYAEEFIREKCMDVCIVFFYLDMTDNEFKEYILKMMSMDMSDCIIKLEGE